MRLNETNFKKKIASPQPLPNPRFACFQAPSQDRPPPAAVEVVSRPNSGANSSYSWHFPWRSRSGSQVSTSGVRGSVLQHPSALPLPKRSAQPPKKLRESLPISSFFSRFFNRGPLDAAQAFARPYSRYTPCAARSFPRSQAPAWERIV
jgi:hypothetical protein